MQRKNAVGPLFAQADQLLQRHVIIKGDFCGAIDQFRYIKIQPKTIDLSTRLWGINTEFVRFIPQSLVLKSIVLG